MAWAGLMLLGVAGAALTMAGSWQAPDMIFLAGAYGSVGSLTLIASAFHGGNVLARHACDARPALRGALCSANRRESSVLERIPSLR